MKKNQKSVGGLYGDIQSWTSGIAQLRERMGVSKENPKALGAKSVRLEGVEPRLVYALLSEFISERPNGIYTVLAKGFPADNLVWWDFLLAAGPHLFNVLSGVNGLSAEVYSIPDGFDVQRFLLHGVERHRHRVRRRADAYEKHEVYANPFYSYRRTVKWLKKEVATTDTDVPPFPGGLYESDEAARRAMKEASDFTMASVRFHVLSKSLLVHAAFMCEALVSTLLRIGALPSLRREPSVLRPLLRSSFMQRVEVLHAYTLLFAAPLDVRAESLVRVRSLMEKRNKYVHGEFSDHTRLKDAYFDGDFPLYGGGPTGQLAEFTTRTYLTPGKAEVLREVETAELFDEFVRSSLRLELRQEIEFMLDQPQLGYNTVKRLYSVPFSSTPFQSVMSLGGGKAGRRRNDGEQVGPESDAADDGAEAPTREGGEGE